MYLTKEAEVAVFPEIPSPAESSEMTAQVAEAFLMTQDSRLALMGARSAAILRLAAAAADRIEKVEGPTARQTFLIGIAVGSVAQLILDNGELSPPPSFDQEFEDLGEAV